MDILYVDKCSPCLSPPHRWGFRHHDVWMELFSIFLQEQPIRSLDALQWYEVCAKKSKPDELQTLSHCVETWRGMLFDLLGYRDEAIECYKKALKIFKEKCGHCSNVDKKWLKNHMKVHLKKKSLSKKICLASA